MLAKSNFRPTDAGITAIYIKLYKNFHSNNKSKFTSWAQSVENAAKLCNMDTLTIALSKLQGPPLKSAHFLESKEVSSGKQLNWHSSKKHLTTNYLEIPYDTHAINAYDNLHQGRDESTSAYLHRIFASIFITQVI